jgi:hypothetical protein
MFIINCSSFTNVSHCVVIPRGEGGKLCFILSFQSFENWRFQFCVASSLLIDAISFEKTCFSLFRVTIFLYWRRRQDDCAKCCNFLTYPNDSPWRVHGVYGSHAYESEYHGPQGNEGFIFSGDGYGRFGATWFHLYPEDGSSMLFQNVGVSILNCTAPCPKRQV